MTTAKIEIPEKLIPVFSPPRGSVRYRGAYGGRGSGKTRTFALMTAVRAYELEMSGETGVILCAREFQNSLDESSMEEVKQAIRDVPWLNDFFDIGERYIRTKSGRIKYIFSGLRHNLDSIKSKARILLCWIDEAEPVSETAYIKLIPTIREDNSECWLTWNPEVEGSPTDKRFKQELPDDGVIVECNFSDNPFFPDVLEAERRRDLKRLDPATYAWIWEGAYRELYDSQVFKGKWRIDEFTPSKDWNGPYHGLDFGFAGDPTAGIKAWIHDNKLFIEYDAGKRELELDATAPYLSKNIPGIEKHAVRADNARPESISYLKRHGLPHIEACKKGKGSVEDGVEHIKSYDEIIIHPRCEHTIKEMRLYSYKVDKLSGDILPAIVDANNHWVDALRYALEPVMKSRQNDEFAAVVSVR